MQRIHRAVYPWLPLLALVAVACPKGDGASPPDSGAPGTDLAGTDEAAADVADTDPGPPSLEALSGGLWVLGVDPWGRAPSLALLDPQGNLLRAHPSLFPGSCRNLATIPAPGDRRAWLWVNRLEGGGSDLVLVDAEGLTLQTVPLAGIDDRGGRSNSQLAACADGSAWVAPRKCTTGPDTHCLLHVAADGTTLADVPSVKAIHVATDAGCTATFLDDVVPATYRRVASDGTPMWSDASTFLMQHKVVVGPDGDAWFLVETATMRGDERSNLYLRRLDGATGGRKGQWELWRDGSVLHDMDFWHEPTPAPRGVDGLWFLTACRKSDPDYTHVAVPLTVDGAGQVSIAWAPENGFKDGGASPAGWETADDGGLWELSGGWGVRRLDPDGKTVFTKKILGEPGLDPVASLADLAAAP